MSIGTKFGYPWARGLLLLAFTSQYSSLWEISTTRRRASYLWDIDDAYRTSGCRVGGHGIYHDHAFCARLPVSMPAAPVAVTPSYPYLASYAVFLLSFAAVRLLSSFSTTRRNNEHEK